jgi:hypothetical protein
MKTMTEELWEKYADELTLEELLEEFDVTPEEALEVLFNEGLLDEELLESKL